MRLGTVVKSNAYGHGMVEVARIVARAGADWLCVNNVEEAVALRAAGLEAPIHVMGYVPLDALEDVLVHDLQPVVYNLETIDRLGALGAERGKHAQVHLKVETGTNRQGVLEESVPGFIARIRERGLELAGVSMHFANIEDTTDHGFAEQQIAAFARVADTVRRLADKPPLFHSASSAATLLFNRTCVG